MVSIYKCCKFRFDTNGAEENVAKNAYNVNYHKIGRWVYRKMLVEMNVDQRFRA